MKKTSTPGVRARRSMIRPNAPARPPDRARAALLGSKPISAAMARMRSRVAAETPGWPFRAKETAALVTPARRAMSAMVGRLIGSFLVLRVRELYYNRYKLCNRR